MDASVSKTKTHTQTWTILLRQMHLMFWPSNFCFRPGHVFFSCAPPHLQKRPSNSAFLNNSIPTLIITIINYTLGITTKQCRRRRPKEAWPRCWYKCFRGDSVWVWLMVSNEQLMWDEFCSGSKKEDRQRLWAGGGGGGQRWLLLQRRANNHDHWKWNDQEATRITPTAPKCETWYM